MTGAITCQKWSTAGAARGSSQPRSPSTISRELARNSDRYGWYRPSSAHAQAFQRASRPKPGKLHTNALLRQRIEQDLAKRYSPEQIVGRLRQEFYREGTYHDIVVLSVFRDEGPQENP